MFKIIDKKSSENPQKMKIKIFTEFKLV